MKFGAISKADGTTFETFLIKEVREMGLQK
jgi:hypothetical protein